MDLEVDDSSLTGETKPSKKHADVVPNIHGGEIPLAERTNIGYLGALVRSGHGKGLVISTGENTEFGSVYLLMKSEAQPKTPLQLKMELLGKQMTYLSLSIIAGIVVIGTIRQQPILEMFNIGVSLAVAAIPEGLPIVVTVTLALGVMRMAKRKAVIKKLPSVETLGAVNVLCVDKTGTLTKNEMTVTTVYTFADDCLAEVKEIGHDHRCSLSSQGKAVASYGNPLLQALMRTAALCNNASLDGGQHIGQPTEVALLSFCQKVGQKDPRLVCLLLLACS